MRKERNRFKVRMACGSNRSHSDKGKFESTVQRMETKWFLKVLIARSAALARCSFGGTR
jgi:hypothetical protein